MLRRARGLEPRLEDYGRIFSLAGTLVLVHCVSLALSTVGLILLVVPGIYLLVSYSIAIPLALDRRSEEHTSELQSRENLVCRLLLEKKNQYFIRARKNADTGIQTVDCTL